MKGSGPNRARPIQREECNVEKAKNEIKRQEERIRQENGFYAARLALRQPQVVKTLAFKAMKMSDVENDEMCGEALEAERVVSKQFDRMQWPIIISRQWPTRLMLRKYPRGKFNPFERALIHKHVCLALKLHGFKEMEPNRYVKNNVDVIFNML